MSAFPKLNKLAVAAAYNFADGGGYRVRHNLLAIKKAHFDPKIDALQPPQLPAPKDGEPAVIISLTTFPARIEEVKYTLYSLFRQSLPPNKIVLCLADDEFPDREKGVPESILRFTKSGMEILWIPKTLRSYQKLVPTLQKYPEDCIVTVDDDLFYRKDWLAALVSSYRNNRDRLGPTIYAHRVHRAHIRPDGRPESYRKWKRSKGDLSPSFFNFATGAGGVLYPPHTLYKDILEPSVFREIAPSGDDIFLWGMEILAGTRIKLVEDSMRRLIYVDPDSEAGHTDKPTLSALNNKNGKNDEQIEKLFVHYPEIGRTLLREGK